MHFTPITTTTTRGEFFRLGEVFRLTAKDGALDRILTYSAQTIPTPIYALEPNELYSLFLTLQSNPVERKIVLYNGTSNSRSLADDPSIHVNYEYPTIPFIDLAWNVGTKFQLFGRGKITDE
eukprot:gene8267-2841_t